jgi:biopolymer transport protein ExbB
MASASPRIADARIMVSVVVWLATLLTLPNTAEAWWNDDWGFRKQIDVDLSTVALNTAQSDVSVLVRLHTGNFAYFLDAKPDGSDLRFIAADDLSPLDFEIEHFDGVAGVAAIWVKLPRLDPAQGGLQFWMYYGNAKATAAEAGPRTWDVNQTAVYHLNEKAGPPRDSTAFGHDMERSSAAPGDSGLIDSGVKFGVEQSMALAATPALTLDAERGNTVSFWLRPESLAEDATLFSQASQRWRLRVGLAELLPYLELTDLAQGGDSRETIRLEADKALVINRWQHFALTVAGGSVQLLLDGQPILAAQLAIPKISGELSFGAANALPGFRGTLDELRLSSIARPRDWLALQSAIQSQDSLMILPGADETRDSAGGLGEYLGLLWALLAAVRAEGWVIIGLLLLMGMTAADVMLSKASLLRKIERADDAFLDAFDAGRLNAAGGEGSPPEAKALQDSPLASLYQVAEREWRAVVQAFKGSGRLPPEALEVVRSALDAETVEQSGRLTARLVLITIAVSGGPFLGLLGTVMGVMITFAAIAAAGDVNVNTIAPGVSAALTTTVMGLLVAIPALFGYNYLTTRITQRTTAMELFADRLVSRLAMSALNEDKAEDLTRAA